MLISPWQMKLEKNQKIMGFTVPTGKCQNGIWNGFSYFWEI
jgi:hypothetical protein